MYKTVRNLKAEKYGVALTNVIRDSLGSHCEPKISGAPGGIRTPNPQIRRSGQQLILAFVS